MLSMTVVAAVTSKEVIIAFGSILLTAITGGLGAWWKLRRSGVSSSALAEITDRAAFRKHLLDQVATFQQGHDACLQREANLRNDLDVAKAEMYETRAELKLTRSDLALAVAKIEALEHAQQ